MSYVDGFVIPIQRRKLGAYLPMARLGRKMWMKHGALDYKECVGDDLKGQFGMSFANMAKTKPGETVVFSYIVFRSRKHRDRVNARVMKEMAKMGGGPPDMPFDVKRVAYGGFKTVVSS
jgi:uncharacterized protein YbaA (DUF1428 family)